MSAEQLAAGEQYAPGQWVELMLPARRYADYCDGYWWQVNYRSDPEEVPCLGQIVKLGRARVQVRIVNADDPYEPESRYTPPVVTWLSPKRIREIVAAPPTEAEKAEQARLAEEARRTQERQAARKLLDLHPVFLDTETTGLGEHDQVIEVAIVDASGAVLFNSLIRPTCPIHPRAAEVHGLTAADLAGAPALPKMIEQIRTATAGRHIVVYNADFDRKMLAQSCAAHGIEPLSTDCQWHCLMQFYAPIWGEWSEYWGNYKWQSLGAAMWQQSVAWPADAHRALADAEASRRLLHVLAGRGDQYKVSEQDG